MSIVVAAAIAAVFSWVGNKLLTRWWKAGGIVFLTPLMEETAKSVAAIYFNQSLILVHGAFGVIEALYDIAFSRRNGPPAALASLFGHLFYGVITQIGYARWGVLAGIALAYLVHSLWNAFVIKSLTRPIK